MKFKFDEITSLFLKDSIVSEVNNRLQEAGINEQNIKIENIRKFLGG